MDVMFFHRVDVTAKTVRNQAHDDVFNDAKINAVLSYFTNLVIKLMIFIISFTFSFFGPCPLIGAFFWVKGPQNGPLSLPVATPDKRNPIWGVRTWAL